MTDDYVAIPDEWLVAAARDDPLAFMELYRRHYDEIFRHCAHRLFDRSIAEDVTATVFFRAARGIGKLNGGAKTFRPWLFRVASNAVTEELRKSRRRKRLLHRYAEQLQRKAAANEHLPDLQADRLEAVKMAMLTLKPAHQSLIALRFFDGRTAEEIAELLGARPATVRSRLSRALAKLREALPPDLFGATGPYAARQQNHNDSRKGN